MIDSPPLSFFSFLFMPDLRAQYMLVVKGAGGGWIDIMIKTTHTDLVPQCLDDLTKPERGFNP